MNMARRNFRIPEAGRALIKLPERGRQLMRKLPEPVQLELGKMSRRSLVLTLEIFAGLLVIGAVALALAYGRLNRGPISLAFLVPTLENAINRELAEVNVKIEDAVVRRTPGGSGVAFRLRNVRLIDDQGAVVAQAPFAAIGLSGRALLGGRIAPGSVDFIGPRLLLFHTPEGGVSLTFSRHDTASTPDTAAGTSPTPAPDLPSAGAEPGLALIAPAKQLNLTKTITAAFERARREEGATSYLTRFGVRDAMVIFDRTGRQSFWQVPDFSIDLEHRQRRSIIFGNARIASRSGPWSLKFRTEQSEKQNNLTFTAFIDDLVPTALASNLPGIAILQSMNLPVSAEASIELSTNGDLKGAEAHLGLSAGHLVAPWDPKHPMRIDEGNLHIRYRAEGNRIELLPSVIKWGASRATISGEMVPLTTGPQPQQWRFHIKSGDARLGVEEFGLPPVKVDQWEASGAFDMAAGKVDLTRFVIRIGQHAVELAGSITDAEGSPAVRMTGRLTPMPVSLFKQIWPKFLAAGAREWVGERVTAGQISGGAVRIDLPAGALAAIENGGDVPPSAVQFQAAASGLEIHYIPGMPPLRTGDAVMTVKGRTFTLDVPKGSITLPGGKQVALGEGSFRIDDLRPDPQTGVIDFKIDGSAQTLLELLDHKPLHYVREVGIRPADFGGKANGAFRISLPLIKALEFEDVKFSGATEVDDVWAAGEFAEMGLQGGSVTFNVTERALDARGDVLIKGVPALLSWQRIFGAPPGKQPELRLTSVLDADARDKLGLDLRHVLRGNVPVIFTVGHAGNGKRKLQVQADLGEAELILTNMGWRKEPGRAAILRFDIGKGYEGQTELQNFRIAGTDISVDGWIALADDHKPNAFYFPDFSFNLLTHMEISGKLREDNVWEVQAQGPSYDGRQFFQSLFSAGQLAEDQAPVPEDAPGLDLTARIGSIVGFFDTNVQDVSVRLMKTAGALVMLDATGKLNGKNPIAAKMVNADSGERLVLAETDDAGSAFRLIGFYPRIEGGQASLQVNMDAAGPAEKSGVLWARDFDVLGDRYVYEVMATTSDDPATNFAEPSSRVMKSQRQRIKFNQMRVPFVVGEGQFVLQDSYINGPQLGATLRGTVDFRTQRIDLGGTYIPLYGLNSALGSIPIIGNLLVGRRGEGVLGITFAVQGPASNPNVLVNPVSMVAPGIFRHIFEYTGRAPAHLTAPPPDRQPPQDKLRKSGSSHPGHSQN